MAKFQYKTKNNSLSIYYRVTNGRNGIDVTKTLPIKLNDDDNNPVLLKIFIAPECLNEFQNYN